MPRYVLREKESAAAGRLWQICEAYAHHFTPTLKSVVIHYFAIDNSQSAVGRLLAPLYFTVLWAYADHKVTRFVAWHASLQRRHEATRLVQETEIYKGLVSIYICMYLWYVCIWSRLAWLVHCCTTMCVSIQRLEGITRIMDYYYFSKRTGCCCCSCWCACVTTAIIIASQRLYSRIVELMALLLTTVIAVAFFKNILSLKRKMAVWRSPVT